MAAMSQLNGFEPHNITSHLALNGPQNTTIHYTMRVRNPEYPSPQSWYERPPGSFAQAALSTTHILYLQDKWSWPLANAQIVTVPGRPIDKGTYSQFVALGRGSGVYLQEHPINNTLAVASQAPTKGVYTGLGNLEY